MLPPLYLISDAARVGEERFLEAAEAAVRAGLRWVQVREPSSSDQGARSLVVRLRERLRPLEADGLRVTLSRRVRIAVELGLDGVHVGGGRTEDVASAREILGPGRIVGYSAHELAELPLAAAAGADYVSFSPVFGAISKQHPLPPLGLEGLRAACGLSTLPVYALGGVTPSAAAQIKQAGAAGAAMIGAILDSPDPASAVTEFLSAWTSTRA